MIQKAKLTSAGVDALMEKCLFTDDESMDDAIKAPGILHTYAFHPGRLAESASDIRAMLEDLPDEFQSSKGGGWSFLNSCNDRYGRQWTGLHLQMERLFCLGIAVGAAQWMMPRDMWPLLPGAMPYVAVLAQEPAP